MEWGEIGNGVGGFKKMVYNRSGKGTFCKVVNIKYPLNLEKESCSYQLALVFYKKKISDLWTICF